jgi:hypothetical protein
MSTLGCDVHAGHLVSKDEDHGGTNDQSPIGDDTGSDDGMSDND